MVSGAMAPVAHEERGVHVVRESRRLLALRLVLSSIVAELGLHHQQCNFSYFVHLGVCPRLLL
ncbi:hypothetical protein Taro_022539 [Colocasia esculenta]|uniref:Uncharacterized protein n=1 Tax=Colocasia esculenta TaxID=4460 RepID=A0A843V423_COLES|nr:hypothetical protein [Colocasia esculenta]